MANHSALRKRKGAARGVASPKGMRRRGRVVEGARLESEYTSKAYRGFESLRLRHPPKKLVSSSLALRSCYFVHGTVGAELHWAYQAEHL